MQGYVPSSDLDLDIHILLLFLRDQNSYIIARSMAIVAPTGGSAFSAHQLNVKRENG